MAKSNLVLPSILTKDSWFFKLHEEELTPFLGQPYLSYSSAESWETYQEDFIKQKFAGLELPFGIYGALGTYVGEAVENGFFKEDNPNGFTGQGNLPIDTLRPEGAEYEKLIIIPREGYFILGFIDIFSKVEGGAKVRDIKTGGKKKEEKYQGEDYTQVVLYAHALELKGHTIAETDVYFVRREGSHIKPPLSISKEQFVIPLEYNNIRVNFALERMDRIAKEISECYKTYLKIFK